MFPASTFDADGVDAADRAPDDRGDLAAEVRTLLTMRKFTYFIMGLSSGFIAANMAITDRIVSLEKIAFCQGDIFNDKLRALCQSF